MATNKNITTTELDFDQIKTNIKTFLKGQDTFKDYDFEGAGLSVLVDLLAYNTHYNALYTNLAVNESFLDSANKRSSVVSRAKEIGYVPHTAIAAKAIVNIVVSSTSTTPATLILPAYSSFSAAIDGKTYTFYNLESIETTLGADNKYTFTNVAIREGVPLTYKYTVATDTRYIIPNIDVDTSTLTVRVQDNSTSSVYNSYINKEDILILDGTSQVYFLKEIEGQLYELEFGNGTIGKALSNGNVVNLSYMTTSKAAANGARLFTYTGSTLLGGVVSVTTTTPAYGGSDIESINSIRYNAPRAYSAQNRAVTVEDYKSIIFRLYPEAASVNAWGGEDNVPPVYGKVFLSIRPATTSTLTITQKNFIINELLKSKNVVSITPEIVDPQYINLEINTTVYYNPRLTAKTESELQSLVIQAIKDYNTENLESFSGVFRFSNLSSKIDASETSIISNITTIKLHREVEVQYNTNANYTINLGNPIYDSMVPEQSLTSTGFYIQGEPDKIMYLEDYPLDEKYGQIKMYYYEGDIKTYYTTFGSASDPAIDYSMGVITLKALEITGLDLTTSPIFELIIKPQSNDVVSVRNQLVTIPDNNINVNLIIDKLSLGDPAGGSSYIFTSSRN
jgi:hypothetical protein